MSEENKSKRYLIQNLLKDDFDIPTPPQGHHALGVDDNLLYRKDANGVKHFLEKKATAIMDAHVYDHNHNVYVFPSAVNTSLLKTVNLSALSTGLSLDNVTGKLKNETNRIIIINIDITIYGYAKTVDTGKDMKIVNFILNVGRTTGQPIESYQIPNGVTSGGYMRIIEKVALYQSETIELFINPEIITNNRAGSNDVQLLNTRIDLLITE
jgi:hypothetical protein